MLLKIRFITGICYLGWLVISTRGQDVSSTNNSRYSTEVHIKDIYNTNTNGIMRYEIKVSKQIWKYSLIVNLSKHSYKTLLVRGSAFSI